MSKMSKLPAASYYPAAEADGQQPFDFAKRQGDTGPARKKTRTAVLSAPIRQTCTIALSPAAPPIAPNIEESVKSHLKQDHITYFLIALIVSWVIALTIICISVFGARVSSVDLHVIKLDLGQEIIVGFLTLASPIVCSIGCYFAWHLPMTKAARIVLIIIALAPACICLILAHKQAAYVGNSIYRNFRNEHEIPPWNDITVTPAK